MTDTTVTFRPAWRNYWLSLSISGVIVFIELTNLTVQTSETAGLFFPIAVFMFGFAAYKRFSNKFTVGENRVHSQRGIISRSQQSVKIKDLRSVELNQSVFQRILRVGDLAFYSAGSSSAEVKFVGIESPLALRDQIRSSVD